MKLYFLFLSLILTFAMPLWASELQVSPTANKMSGVVINQAATTVLEGQTIPLAFVAAGLRTKTIAKVKIYVAQLYVSDLPAFEDASMTALKDLEKPSIKVVALQLNVLHSLSVEQLADALTEGFKANNIPMRQDVLDGLAAVGGVSRSDGTQTLVLVGRKLANGSETLTLENSETGKTDAIVGSKGLITDVLSVWLGVPADSGLAALKKSLIGDRP